MEKRFGPYEFALDRIDSPLKLLGWVEHLSGKVWMKSLDLRELIIAVSEHFGWDIFNAWNRKTENDFFRIYSRTSDRSRQHRKRRPGSWPCPECDDRTAFGTLPHKAGCKDRVMCHRCGFRGDEADLIRFFNPRESWPQRRAKLADWFAAWNAGHVPEPVGISHRGMGSTEPAGASRTSEDPSTLTYDPAVGRVRPGS